MDLGLLFSDPERALHAEGGRSLKWEIALLIAFSLIFGLLSAVNVYVIGASQFEIFLGIIDSTGQGGQVATLADEILQLGNYLVKVAIAAAVAGTVFKFSAVTILAAVTCLLMRLMGSKASFHSVLQPAVCLILVPLIILAFSTLLNAASYMLTGIVPLGNTAIVPSLGWILYYFVLSSRYLRTEGLEGYRRLVPLLPLVVMALWNVFYAASLLSWPLLQNALLERALEGIFR